MMVFIERVGRCPNEWLDPDRIQRILDLHDNARSSGRRVLGFYGVGGSDPDDGPTHRVEELTGGHRRVTVFGPWWMQDGDLEDWRDWTDAVSDREEIAS